MAARKSIQVLTGPNGSIRSPRIDALLQESKDTTRLLVPTVAQARARRETYFAAEGCAGAWGTPVMSLTDFAQQLLEREGVAVTRFDSGFQQRLLMEHCLEEVAVENPETRLVQIPRTPGLIRHLVSVVNDLKQAAIEPEDFAARLAAADHTGPLDDGVALVYSLYQQSMQEDGLYDVPGLYWHADYFVANGAPRILAGVTTLLWDGFDDFTPSEFRLFQSLAARVDKVVVGLNLDLAPDRQDRYTLTRHTLERLREHLECRVVECEAPPQSSQVDFAARHLFWRDEPALPEGLTANLTVLPCSDALHELETIARRVKKLIVEEKVAPSAIAVVYWNMKNLSEAVRGVFNAFGVPSQRATERRLSETNLGRTLLKLFNTAAAWEREAILDLLVAPCLHAAIGVVPEATAYYARRAQILSGAKEWVYRLGRLRDQLARGEREDARRMLARRPDAVVEIDALLSALAGLQSLQGQLPAKGTQYDFAVALETLLESLERPEDNPWLVEEDGPAREGIRGLLELLADGPGSDVVEMSRDEFLDRVSDGMEELTCTLPGTPGGVACLDASQVRNQRYAHVFVGGLNEGKVPAPPAGNAVYPEGDRERLHEAGIPIESNQEHHARQRMLFGHVLECAEVSLTLSWQLVQDSGREASPSPFLTDVRELFPVSSGVVAAYPAADSFLPEPSLIASPRDVLNRAFYGIPDLATAFPALCAPCAVGAAVEMERHSHRPFGAFDGVLQDPALIAAVATDYGTDHEFSVNQLETYLGCPFDFYVKRVLHLEESDAPDSTVGPLIRGSILHDILQAFHEQFAGLHLREIGLQKADEAMESLLEAAFKGQDWNECAAPRGAILAEKIHMAHRLRRYVRAEHGQEEEQHWKPTHFEVAFGRSAGEDPVAPSTRVPFEMARPGCPVRFTGRIDRIDRSEAGVRLIDYKSGGVPGTGDITSGQSIQLSVYAEAAEQLLMPGTPCTEARYLAVGKTDRREALGVDQTKYNWPKRVENMYAAIDEAVAGIRSGSFPPQRGGKQCYGCGHARACRFEEARVARKMGIENGE